MATNSYFSLFNNTGEQLLIENLIIESIKTYGLDVYYMRRRAGSVDEIYNEDDQGYYDSAVALEMYIKNVDSFEGEGDFLSKFGLQIRDSMTFTVAQKRFNEELNDDKRPMEGDLIYFPLNKKIFQVMHTEHEAIFYQLGSLQTYDLKCDLYEYSNEVFNTGIAVIDEWNKDHEQNDTTTFENLKDFDPWADNKPLQDKAAEILDFDAENPFGSDTY